MAQEASKIKFASITISNIEVPYWDDGRGVKWYQPCGTEPRWLEVADFVKKLATSTSNGRIAYENTNVDPLSSLLRRIELLTISVEASISFAESDLPLAYTKKMFVRDVLGAANRTTLLSYPSAYDNLIDTTMLAPFSYNLFVRTRGMSALLLEPKGSGVHRLPVKLSFEEKDGVIRVCETALPDDEITLIKRSI